MLNRLIAFSLQQRLLVLLAVLALAGAAFQGVTHARAQTGAATFVQEQRDVRIEHHRRLRGAVADGRYGGTADSATLASNSPLHSAGE